MNKNRDKGHRFERKVRLDLLEHYPECITSRLGSKYLDNQGIDLMFTGIFKIQCKNVSSKISYATLFSKYKCNTLIIRQNKKTVVIFNEEISKIITELDELPLIIKKTHVNYLEVEGLHIYKGKKFAIINYERFKEIARIYKCQSMGKPY